ncbi:MAG: bifunctional phosphoglucose/phosphomannose isomerase [Thermoplasmata archaeon]|nr:bifunctional phosphoglucose/phosphomannose isomerase [Thermoplasmata archaeon]
MLDSPDAIRSLDSRDMLGTIEQMSKHLAEGVRRGRMAGIPRYRPTNVVVCGMGGSAIGGDLLAEWMRHVSDVPCFVRRSYNASSVVDKGSLVIVSSYSGNTEETMSMFEDARRRGAKIVAIASGGRISEMASSAGVPVARVPNGLVPRASLGFLLGAMIGILEKSGVVDPSQELEEAAKVLDETASSCSPDMATHRNPAKRLAHEVFGTIPVVAGHGLSAPVAKRWANQLNENGKVLAFATEIPEMNHNEIVGWMRDGRCQGFSMIVLEHEERHTPMHRRVNATKAMIARRTGVFSVHGSGTLPLTQMLSLVMVGDYVSAYLGILRKEDPSSTEPIHELKSILSEK